MDAPLEFEPTKEDLLIIREWIAKTPHIVQDYDDYFLAAFIRASKRRLQKAKILLENFNGLGHRYPKSFGHLDPLNKATQIFLNGAFAFPLPKRTEDGSLICMLYGRYDPEFDLSNYNLLEMLRFWHMSLLVHVWEKQEGNTKIIIVYDCSNEKLVKMKTATPSFLRDALQLLATSPVRLQAFHFVNVPSFLMPIVSFIKTFTKTKMVLRLYFHSNIDSLCEMIPRKYLPREYGGSEANIRTLHDSWKKKIESYRDKLIKESDKMRRLDPLRPKLEGHDQELGGTFRQLHID